jgi:hypothetical protein
LAYEVLGLKLGTLKAPSTAFYAKQYHMVISDTTEGYIKTSTTAAGSYALGILQNKPAVTGEACEIALPGSVSKVVANSTKVTVGKRFWNKGGRAGDTGTIGAGVALYGPVLESCASTADNVISVCFMPIGITT